MELDAAGAKFGRIIHPVQDRILRIAVAPLEVVGRILEPRIDAESAAEAMEVIEELVGSGLSLLVIVSDWLMPGVRGDEFLTEVNQKFPGIVKILLTGQADDAAIQRAWRNADIHRCLAKPWNPEELFETIGSGLTLLEQRG